MAAYYGNNAAITVDGESLDTYFVSMSLEASMEAVDITHGSGVAHRQRGEGLKDTSGTLVIIYDTTDIQTLLPLLEPGEHTIEYMPEGNTAGKPYHKQDFIITGVPHEVVVEKAKVQFTASLEAVDAPYENCDMFAGSVVPAVP